LRLKRSDFVCHTDEHKAYPRALRRVPHLEIDQHKISSRAERNTKNPLFSINHTRQPDPFTACRSQERDDRLRQRRQCSAERLWVFAVWKNWIKSFSEQKKDAVPRCGSG
jgi:hypothetical protein